MHLALEDQPITCRDWTDDRTVLYGYLEKARKTAKAVVIRIGVHSQACIPQAYIS